MPTRAAGAQSGSYKRLARLVTLSLVALVALGATEWVWVRRATAEIASIPQRTVLVTQQRMLATLVVSNSIALMQAPSAPEREPWRIARESARERLDSAIAQLTRATAKQAEASEASGVGQARVSAQIRDVVRRTDALVAARQSGERGPLAETEIRSLVALNDSVSALVDAVNKAELTWAAVRTTRLQTGQTVVFLLIGVVLVLLTLVVLRPVVKRLAGMAELLAASNANLETKSHELEQSATELAAQNHELLQQQLVMEQHRQLMEELQQSATEREARHRSVLESMAEGMVLVRADGRVLSWNASALQLLGVNDAEMRARRPDRPLFAVRDTHGVLLQDDQLPLAQVLSEGSITGAEYQLQRGDAPPRWLRLNARLVDNLDNSPPASRSGRMAVLTFVDITAERAREQQLRNLSVAVEQTDQAIAMSDAALRLIWVNSAWTRTTGYTLDEARGRRPGELLHGPHTAAETVERMRAAVRMGESIDTEVLNYRKDGSPFWMEVHTTPLRDDHGQISAWVSVQRDVTARKETERERQQMAAALAVTNDGIGIINAGGAFEFVNHALARLLHLRPGALMHESWTRCFAEAEARRLQREVLPQVMRLGAWTGESEVQRKAGDYAPVDLSITLLPTGGLICMLRDVSDRKRAEVQLRTQAIRDELTQLYNRRGFFQVATAELAQQQQRGGKAVLLYGDADRFKQVNDQHGHETGDRVLRLVADVLRTHLRTTDIVARLGGDEFTALLPDTDVVSAPDIVRKLQEALADAVRRTGLPIDVGLSLGFAGFDALAPEDLDTLLRQADQALYSVKSALRVQIAA